MFVSGMFLCICDKMVRVFCLFVLVFVYYELIKRELWVNRRDVCECDV